MSIKVIRKNNLPRDGKLMAKSFLILMLMTTQLLAASGGSVYVCIRNDGTLCCLDRGPSDCDCCEEEKVESATFQKVEIPEGRGGCGCGCSNSDLSCELDDSLQPEQFSELTAVSDDPCGCTHLLISHDQGSVCPANATPVFDASRLIQCLFEAPAHFNNDVASNLRNAAFQQFKPPPISSQAIIVLSWVLIQC